MRQLSEPSRRISGPAHWLGRTVAVAATALAMLAVTAAPAAATHPVTAVPFSADHEVGCLSMFTRGSMVFDAAEPGQAPYVAVAGLLAAEPTEPCGLVLADVYAEFEAFIGLSIVDREDVHLNPPTGAPGWERAYAFTMTNRLGSATVPIEYVTVRVCRAFGPMLPAFSCGDTVTVRPAP